MFDQLFCEFMCVQYIWELVIVCSFVCFAEKRIANYWLFAKRNELTIMLALSVLFQFVSSNFGSFDPRVFTRVLAYHLGLFHSTYNSFIDANANDICKMKIYLVDFIWRFNSFGIGKISLKYWTNPTKTI